ncbi:hypothetical protein PF002_g11280 [Phytophthora fragariae]|uniref:Uncharacterized protein n=1 Tax=Phytophthora fragariae TaxID=53985 RepID=A0A6A3ZJW0_9STRA|nr:hypothetical protein PF003_g32543 [Phytophthora fragariae]KAE9236281.1 hypothetical protein PF002_g11280 [Phytophthora fragariae]
MVERNSSSLLLKAMLPSWSENLWLPSLTERPMNPTLPTISLLEVTTLKKMIFSTMTWCAW